MDFHIARDRETFFPLVMIVLIFGHLYSSSSSASRYKTTSRLFSVTSLTFQLCGTTIHACVTKTREKITASRERKGRHTQPCRRRHTVLGSDRSASSSLIGRTWRLVWLQQGRGKDGGSVGEGVRGMRTCRASSSASIACLAHSSTGSLYSWAFELFFWRKMCGFSGSRESEGRYGKDAEEERRNRIRNQQCTGQEKVEVGQGKERASGRTSAANIASHALELGLSWSLHDSIM